MAIEIQPQLKPVETLRGRIGRYLFNVVCTVVSVVALGFILPAAFGLERYVIAGGSMTGSISKGSVVFEEVVPVSELRVGDVITYMPPNESSIENLVTHRIVEIDGISFRTKGDANADVDPWTFDLPGDTQPRVVADVPLVGYVIIALQDRETRMAVIGVPAALVALYSLADLLLGLRRRRASATVDPLVEPGTDEDDARLPGAPTPAPAPTPASTPAPAPALVPVQGAPGTSRPATRPATRPTTRPGTHRPARVPQYAESQHG